MKLPLRSLPFFHSLTLLLLFAVFQVTIRAGVNGVGAIGLTVNDLQSELLFYTNTLPFQLVGISQIDGRSSGGLLNLESDGLRVAELRLGGERITLTEHILNKGRRIPPDSRSFDHWFQHIAIVVRDMDTAYKRLVRYKVKHVSTGPQTLPDWNPSAAGIRAFYFQDPEEHVLEIIYFPAGKGDPKWQQRNPNGGFQDPVFLGIDHTAIVVSDTERSLAFYHGLLGLRIAGESENYGTEQEHLNQVFGARLHITSLRAEAGPGIEFLEYLAPPGGRPAPLGTKANDLIFWCTRLATDQFDELTATLHKQKAGFISKEVGRSIDLEPNYLRSVILRDPDGHALELRENVR